MFENLPNEIILLIYSHLDLTTLHHAFSSLNSRFDQLLYDNFTPLYACISLKCDFPFEKYSNRIKKLCLINWNSTDVLSFISQNNLPKINYFKIQSIDNSYFGQPTNDLIRHVYSFKQIYVYHFEISPTIYIGNFNIPKCESIKHLHLSMITLDPLFHLLTCSPNLLTLNIWLNSNGRQLDTSIYRDYQCLKLNVFAVGLHNDILFDEVTFLLSRMPILRVLKICGTVWDQRFLSHHMWGAIIMGNNSFPMLDKLNVKLSVRFMIETQNRIQVLISHFRRNLFKRIKFCVYCSQGIWVKIKCSWDKNIENIQQKC